MKKEEKKFVTEYQINGKSMPVKYGQPHGKKLNVL